MADQPCIIGSQITIQGSLTGAEDLIVEGRIEGTIKLSNHLTVASGGVVDASPAGTPLLLGGGGEVGPPVLVPYEVGMATLWGVPEGEE